MELQFPEDMDSYCDLCIQENPQTLPVLEDVFSHRCHIVCINRDVDLTAIVASASGSSNPKEVRRVLREGVAKQLIPMNLSRFKNSNLAKYARVHGAQAKLLSRLTIRFEDVDDIQHVCQTFPNELAKNFDVIAACPCTDQAFNYCCDQMGILDLIQFDIRDKPKCRMTHQMVRRARDRSINFELLLAPMLSNASSRAYAVSVTQNFVEITGGRSLVMSSGAQSVWDVRNHIGLISVAAMLGVRPDVAPKCVREVPKAVLKHALIRTHTIFGAMAVEKLESQPGVKSVTFVGREASGSEKAGPSSSAEMSMPSKRVINLDEACDTPPKKKKRKHKKNKEYDLY